MALWGVMTVTLAVPGVAFGPVSVDVTVTELFFNPSTVPFTLTTMVQEALVASVPPDKLIEPDPAVAVTLPPQTPTKPLGVATTSPDGKLSVKATPVSDRLAFGLVMVKVRLVEPLRTMVGEPNAFAIVGSENGGLTVCGSPADVLPLKLLSPA